MNAEDADEGKKNARRQEQRKGKSKGKKMNFNRRCYTVLVLVLLLVSTAWGQVGQKPKVRAITAFVRIDHDHYQQQIQDALTMLRAAKAAYEKEGYEVETIRITTQPFPEYVSGMSEEQALAFLKALDDLSVKEKFLPNVGPGMRREGDDPRYVDILK